MCEGSIQSSLSSLEGLKDLNLSRNNLSGQIPEFLQGFVFLQYLNLSSNNLKVKYQDKESLQILALVLFLGIVSSVGESLL